MVGICSKRFWPIDTFRVVGCRVLGSEMNRQVGFESSGATWWVFMGKAQLNLLQVVQGDQCELTEKLGVSSKDIFRTFSEVVLQGLDVFWWIYLLVGTVNGEAVWGVVRFAAYWNVVWMMLHDVGDDRYPIRSSQCSTSPLETICSTLRNPFGGVRVFWTCLRWMLTTLSPLHQHQHKHQHQPIVTLESFEFIELTSMTGKFPWQLRRCVQPVGVSTMVEEFCLGWTYTVRLDELESPWSCWALGISRNMCRETRLKTRTDVSASLIREVDALQTLCSRYLVATSAREKGGHFL